MVVPSVGGMERFPEWLEYDTHRSRGYWRRPWTVPTDQRKAKRFKKLLWKHGLLSPHFSRKEAESKDGTPIPERLRDEAQRQAFFMERVRHEEGDKPMKVLSWFRSKQHNANEGGVPNSRHLTAQACDPLTPIKAATAEKVFRNGAVGYQSPSNRTVRHVDSRPERVRYFYE